MPLGLWGDTAGWVARGEARTRDNEKSKTGLLGVADIDEYLTRGGNRRRGGAWWRTLEWTWRPHRLMMCRLPHSIYSWGLAFCHNLFIIISHLPFMNHLRISEDEGSTCHAGNMLRFRLKGDNLRQPLSNVTQLIYRLLSAWGNGFLFWKTLLLHHQRKSKCTRAAGCSLVERWHWFVCNVGISSSDYDVY